MQDFVHLHLHSEYSLLDGACRIADIPAAAKAAGHKAVAITDHGVMYGAVAFYRACKAEGLKPVIGCEVYLAPRTRFDKTHELDSEYYHLVLLVKNETGYKNLIYMVSQSFTEGFYSKPRIDIELLRSHNEGLIALSACMFGYLSRHILNGNIDEAKAHARTMLEIFGNDNYYIEIQDHGIEGQREINRGLAEISSELDIPLVATNDVHYLKKSDAEIQSVLMCIQTNTTVDSDNAMRFQSNELYYKSTEEMESILGTFPGAIENTVLIAERCNFDFEFDKLYLPRFHPEDGSKPEEYLRALAYSGLKEKTESGGIDYTPEHPESEYLERCEYELSVISHMGYAEYYLIVRDFVCYAKEHGVPTGPGRGSGAGSLVAFLLNITEVDSIKYNLLFERFLNPERISMPDFDIDFSDERRDDVIKYVSDHYGRDHVSQIVTFGTLAARAAVRDVGRALGMSYAEVDAVAKKIPQQFGIKLKDAMQDKDLLEVYNGSEKIRKLLDTALAVEGMPRHMSVHAAGIVITDRPVSEYVPLALSGEYQVTQFDMDTIAALGLLKFDFLALRNLTVIANTEKQIREFEPDFSVSKIRDDDSAAYEMIGQGSTDGVFQLESGGMRQLLYEMKPKNLRDIMIAIALYRPGPMESIPRFLRARFGTEPILYKLPQLESILSDTCGCIVYQEQVMQICCAVAGFTMGHADIVRKAMSKKKSGQIEKEREAFLSGAEKNGCDIAAATEIFEEMIGFAKYAFNKSHAAAYSVVSYRTAYLKANYPRQYMASLLTSVLGNIGKTAEYFAECSKLGIKILPPDINESEADFAVSGENIRFGMLAIKNVGRSFIESVVSERKKRAFTSFDSFISRMVKSGADINKRQIESLIKSGVFDSLGIFRSRLMAEYEKIIDSFATDGKKNVAGQLDLFSAAFDSDGGEYTQSAALEYKYPDIAEYDTKTRLTFEKESAGFYFSGHLLDDYTLHISALDTVAVGDVLAVSEVEESVNDENVVDGDSVIPSSEILSVNNDAGIQNKDLKVDERSCKEGDVVTVCGIITRIVNKQTKNGDSMAFVTLEDRYNEIELVIFPKVLEKNGMYIGYDGAVLATGEISVREEENPKLLVRELAKLVPNDLFEKMTDDEKQRVMVKNYGQNPKTSYSPRQNTNTERNLQHSNQATNTNSNQEKEVKPKILYLRVDDTEGVVFQKAVNLIEIFCGFTEVVFYNKSSGKYISAGNLKIGATDFVIDEMEALLGNENVVLK